MKKLVVTVSLLGMLAVVTRSSEAQARFGTQISLAEDSDFGIGARVGFPLGGELKRKGIEGMVAFDYFFPKGFNVWELSANGLYHFTQGSSVKPYVGGGLLFSRASLDSPIAGINASGSDFGLNLIGGLRFKAQERLLPFVEARFELSDGTQFVVAGGVYFGKP